MFLPAVWDIYVSIRVIYISLAFYFFQEGVDIKSEKKLKDNERLIKRLTGIWEEKWIKTKEIIKVKKSCLRVNRLHGVYFVLARSDHKYNTDQLVCWFSKEKTIGVP